jgi:hypothetical protein
MLRAFLSQGNFTLFSENFKLVRLITRGKVLEVSPWRVRVEMQWGGGGGLLEEGVWCLAEIEISSAKTEMCDC